MAQISKTQKVTLASILVAMGIIYGDIGTSPLYVFKAVLGTHQIDEMLVLGGISCIFWTLTLQTSIKYVWLTLRADNEGEGGIFSLYALVRRFNKKLVIPTILGATTLLADGIITPPISVASAVEGLEMIPSLGHIPTVPIVIVILSLLFFFQRYGTQKLGSIFGVVMAIWFTTLLVVGLSWVIKDPTIFRIINPYYAYQLLAHYPAGFWILGAVFLCVTGAEALYSDLGHCGKENIRWGWVYVKTALVINYMGQAVWVLNQGQGTLNGRNPFFEIMPAWFLLPSILLATAATIIASQALISGSYTLISEAMNLNFWPRVSVRQPTERKGQIYIPSVNTILWVGCVMMILYFRSSTHMEAAYGFSITVAMMMTTILLGYYMSYRLRWNKWLIAAVMFLFATVELSFFVANVAKIKERWMFLFFELFIFLVMYIWHEARKINNKFTQFVDLGQYSDLIVQLSEDDNVPKFSTHLIYLTKANHRHEIEEKSVKSILSKKPKRADVYWFVHIHRTDQPYTLSYDVSELIDDKMIKVTLNVGFRIQPRTELYFKKIVQELVAQKELNLHIRPDGSTPYNPEPDFKFVVIEKFLSVENEFALKERVLLNTYFFLKRLGLSDEKAFGLDKSDVAVEQIPLIYQAVNNIELTRINK